ncbi:MFS transporter [Tuanshanicoccus lijuaniae]|uniref:MFS transporter n=1 Tax=Aerococcaceae bacterium zg-1292 TaxID=2774330 RepID=UPI00193733D7|nr:MFS transporter [Aerococcaceae bacterium zg-1292]MBF6626408.1 MFS transporter [Aerococcaceae bacterium zg-BR9]QQA37086.1 MFS transporter [Aerococcaceae bacterium zg-1292]
MKRNHIISDKLPWYQVLAWSTRGVSLSCNIVIVGYLTYYCTNVLAMPASLVGTILLVSKLFDGFTDLIAGYIIDNTNTKLGKARPYEVSIIFVWLTTLLMFSCPNLGMVGKSIWIFATYTLANSVFATLLNASESVYISRAVKSDMARNILVSVNGIIIMFGSIIVSTVFPILIGTLGTSPEGWQKMIAIFALPLGTIGIGRFLFVKERTDAVAAQNHRVDMKTLINALKSNKFIFLLAGAVLLYNFINSVGTVGTYYFQYIVGDVKKASIVGLISLITPLVLIFMPAILKRLTFSKVVSVGAMLGIFGNVIKGLAGSNMGLIIVGNLLGVLAALPLSFYAPVMVISCMDYSEWKNGERVEGAFSAVNGFASKVGAGLSSVVTGFVMGIARFDGTLAVQSDAANNAIIALYSWIPAIFFAVIIVLMKFYKLDDMMPQISADLEARRNQ